MEVVLAVLGGEGRDLTTRARSHADTGLTLLGVDNAPDDYEAGGRRRSAVGGAGAGAGAGGGGGGGQVGTRAGAPGDR